MHEANRLFSSALGRGTCGDEGSAFERESDVGSCSLMSLETETSLASVGLLGKTRCMLERYSQFELSRNIHIVAFAAIGSLDQRKSYSEYSSG